MAVSSGIIRKSGTPSAPGVGRVFVPGQAPIKPEPLPTAPAPAPRPQSDPRIQQLIEAIRKGQSGQSELSARLRSLSEPGKVPALDLSGIEGQSAQLRDLSSRLMRGEGIDIGDVSNDPSARAYAVAQRRGAERAREEAAARLGASGVSGSGDFDSEAAKIRESTETNIAQNLADTTTRRRTEALAAALQGANLQMGDLDRQTRAKLAEHQAAVDAERLQREGLLAEAGLESSRLGNDQSTNLALLNTLLGQDALTQNRFDQEQERSRTAEGDRLSEEMRKRELEDALLKQFNVGRPKPRGGFTFPSVRGY